MESSSTLRRHFEMDQPKSHDQWREIALSLARDGMTILEWETLMWKQANPAEWRAAWRGAVSLMHDETIFVAPGTYQLTVHPEAAPLTLF